MYCGRLSVLLSLELNGLNTRAYDECMHSATCYAGSGCYYTLPSSRASFGRVALAV